MMYEGGNVCQKFRELYLEDEFLFEISLFIASNKVLKEMQSEIGDERTLDGAIVTT